MTTDRFATGMSTRRAVLGDAHVDRAEAGKTDFDEPFQTLITKGAWGKVWSNEMIVHAIPDADAVERLTAVLDLNATIPLEIVAYKFDIVVRGRRSTLFENRLEGN